MIDFDLPECRSQTSDMLFGICDDQHGAPAFIDTAEPDIWIAKVENPAAIDVTMIAVDTAYRF